ncbi:uncharacterized protein [Eurosta solidaginis]|uniref:uncharacterized protein n=1 Tax=Eurosta solidaginis TaxID=178769 RepID=UPI00353079DB
MDLSVKRAAAMISSNHFGYRHTYGQSGLVLPPYHENMVLRNSPFNDTERLSPLSNSSTDYIGIHDNAISMYKRARLTSESEYRSSPSDDSGIDLMPEKPQPDNFSLQASQSRDQQHMMPTPTGASLRIKTIDSSQLNQNVDNAQNNAKKLKLMLKPTNQPIVTLKLTNVAALSSISKDKLSDICTFHSNMVREFPKKQRTAKEQELRNKNTIACRMSRRLKKLEQVAAEEQCKELEQRMMQQMEQKLRVSAVLMRLMAMSSVAQRCNDNIDVAAETEEAEIDVVGLEDTHAVPVFGEWKYNASVGKIQWQMRTFVASASPTLVGPAKASCFSIDYLLGK